MARSGDKKVPDEFQLMRQIFDNLQYLDYETAFDPVRRHLPFLSPFYFALPGQSAKEQFDYFAHLSAWIMQTFLGSDIETPSDYDDPSQIADNLILALPAVGIKMSASSSKLVPGHGFAVCLILDALLRLALKKRRFSPNGFRAVAGFGGQDDMATVGGSDDEAVVDDAVDVQGEDDDDIELVVGADYVQESRVIDSLALKAEAERVAPRLQIRIPAAKSDWRSHFGQMNQHHARITELMGQLTPILAKVGADVTRAIQSIQTREKNLNSRFEASVGDYGARASQLADIEGMHRGKVAEVTKLQDELNAIARRLTNTKDSLNEKQKHASDNSPLMRIKTAMMKLREEVKGLELQSAILQRSLTQSWLEDNELEEGGFA